MGGIHTGYGPPVGRSPEDYPVYIYTDPQSQLSTYVVVLPDGRAFYSDQHGKIVANPIESDRQVGLAVLGGIVGFLLGFGPVGAITGALVGAIAGGQISKRQGK
jgi:hypothetical protein